MLRQSRSRTFALVGITTLVVMSLVYNCYPWPYVFLKMKKFPDYIRNLKQDYGKLSTNWSSQASTTNKSLSLFFVDTPFQTFQENRRFLQLTDQGVKALSSPKVEHSELWSKEPYLNRKRNLRRRCDTQPLNKVIDLSRYIYDDDYKIIMCVVPKAASTTWKKFIWYLKGKMNKQEIDNLEPYFLALNYGKLKPMSSLLSKWEAIKRFTTYTSFFVMRNPFERLVSAYVSKFTSNSIYESYKKILGKKIASEQAEDYLKGLKYIYNRKSGATLIHNSAFAKLSQSEKDAALQYVQVMNTGNISFHQLVKYITRKNKNPFNTDVHWRSQVNMCNPCVVNYDFSVRFEMLVNESNFLLEYLQRGRTAEKKVYFDSFHSAHTHHKAIAEAFKELDKELLENITNMYKSDFRILDYSLYIGDSKAVER